MSPPAVIVADPPVLRALLQLPPPAAPASTCMPPAVVIVALPLMPIPSAHALPVVRILPLLVPLSQSVAQAVTFLLATMSPFERCTVPVDTIFTTGRGLLMG